MRTVNYWRVVVSGFFALRLLSGGDVFQARFGHPLIYTDRIVFTSVDGKSLLGINKEGNQKWEIHLPQRIHTNTWNDKSLLVQSGREVLQVDVQEGTWTKLVTMPEFQVLTVDESNHSLLATVDTRYDHHRVQILDPLRYTTVWQSSAIESIIQVTPATIVAVTADRELEKHGSYHLKNVALCGYNRSDGHVRWSIPLSDSGLVTSASTNQYLAVVERLRTYDGTGSTELLILNPETGAMLHRLKGEFSDLSVSGDSLTVLESAGGPGEARLYTCNLPDCTKSPGVHLSAKEILRHQIYQDYLLTWGIYDSACFSRATGERLWQKGQIEWSEPFGSEMMAADVSSQGFTARIISIDLQTGVEHVLFSRRVLRRTGPPFTSKCGLLGLRKIHGGRAILQGTPLLRRLRSQSASENHLTGF